MAALRVLYCWLISLMLVGQEVPVRKIGVEEGLPSQRTFDVVALPNGFIWTATSAGLVRFDGKESLVFTTSEGLPDNSIKRMAYDPQTQSLWFLTSRGRVGWVTAQHQVVLPEQPKLRRLEMVDLTPGLPGSMWLADANGEILCYQNQRIQHETRMVQGKVVGMVCDSTGKLWVLSNQPAALWSFQPNTQKVPGLVWQSPTEKVMSRPVLLSNGDLAWSTLSGLWRFQPHSSHPRPVFLTDAFQQTPIHCLLPDEHGKIWVGTPEGLWLIGRKNGSFQPLKRILQSYQMKALSKDFEGNIWVATANSGVLYLPDQQMSVQSYGSKPADHVIQAMEVTPDGRLWAGNIQGVVFYGVPNERAVPITLSQRVPVLKLCQAGNHMWIGTEQGLYRSDQPKKPIWPREKITALATDGADYLFVGTPQTLHQLHVPSQNWKTYYTGAISSMFWHPFEKALWMATPLGIQRWTPQGAQRLVSVGLLQGQEISDLCYDAERDMVWASTLGAGIWGLQGKQPLLHISSRQGLVSDMIFSMHLDDDGHLWAATPKGIHQLVFSGRQVAQLILWDKTHGLPSYEVSQVKWFGGKVFAATPAGVVFFEPQKPKEDVTPPPVFINRLFVNNMPKPRADTLWLDPFENNLQVDVRGISYRDPSGIRFSYVLEGLSPTPVMTSSGNLSFQALAPGWYTLSILAMDRNGLASQKPAKLTIYIQPAFWQTLAFKISVFLLLAAGIGVLFYLRLRWVRRREREKAAFTRTLNELKLTALKAQMNPHFLFNSLGSIQNLINTDRKKEANQYLARFAKLLRMVLDQSEEREVTLAETMAQLELYLQLESLRFSEAFTYQIFAPSQPQSIPMPPLMIQPFVENAIKHGLLPKGNGAHLMIRFELRPDQTLYCCIEDNGIGRVQREIRKGQSRADHVSKGISITQDRLQLLNDLSARKTQLHITDLYDAQGHAAGTRVELILPLPETFQQP